MIGKLLMLGLGAYAANQAYKQYRTRNGAMGSGAMSGSMGSSMGSSMGGSAGQGTVLDTDSLRGGAASGSRSMDMDRSDRAGSMGSGGAMGSDLSATARNDDSDLSSGNNAGRSGSASGTPTLSPERGPGPMQ